MTAFVGLNNIEITLEQDGREVQIVQDCTEYLKPLTTLIYKMMGMGISTYALPNPNPVSSACSSECSTANTVISNLSWTKNDSLMPFDRGEILVGRIAPSINSEGCGEDCAECRQHYYENEKNNIWYQCVDERPMRFTYYCPNWMSKDKCSPNDKYCMRSYPYGDADKTRSTEYTCRSLPDKYIGNLEDSDSWSRSSRECRSTKGLCYYGCDGGKCYNSWFKDDPYKGKSASAMCRCMN